MKKIIFLSLFALSFYSLASDLNFKCKRLQNGNFNGKSTSVAKAVDVKISLNLETQDAYVDGTMITKASAYDREGAISGVTSYFIGKRNVEFNDQIFTISSYQSRKACLMDSGICRFWDTLTIDLEKKEAVFEQAISKELMFGEKEYITSLSFTCVQN